MQPLSSQDILQLWERGEDRHPVDRALLLLTVSCPERSREELAELSIGQRDKLLMTFWELTFGPRLKSYAECPRCGEALEFSLGVQDLLRMDAEEAAESEGILRREEFEAQFRLPNSVDLAQVAFYQDIAEARTFLVRRCVLQAWQGAAEIEVEKLPEPFIVELGNKISEQDPLAEVRIHLRCSRCEHRWPVMLDMVSFFWAEIAAQAKRLLREIHTLAWAYGWREADILAMNPRRRRRYLEMVA